MVVKMTGTPTGARGTRVVTIGVVTGTPGGIGRVGSPGGVTEVIWTEQVISLFFVAKVKVRP